MPDILKAAFFAPLGFVFFAVLGLVRMLRGDFR